MELNLQKQTVSVNEVIYDGTAEQPLECDVLLPDYCPDIQKILRCEVEPALLCASVIGEKLSVDGVAVVHLYYLDENGCLRRAEYKIPYTKGIELRCAPNQPSIQVTQSVDYFNCRAVSARRLDMRGAVSICIRISSRTEEEIICGAQDAGMQFCRERMENTVMLPQTVRQLTVHEEIALAYGKAAIANVVRCSAYAEVSDYKVISGKVVTKGEAHLHILYQCEEEGKNLEGMDYTLPICQVIDMEGLDEDCTCSVWYEVCTLEVSPKRDLDGENRSFGIEMVINACAAAHRREQLDICRDCYSTQYECKSSHKQMPVLELVDEVNETCMYKELLDLPEKVCSMIDLWCVVGAASIRMEEGSAVISGKVTVCMLVCEEDETIAYYDQIREYHHQIPLKSGDCAIQFTPVVQAAEATFSMSGHHQIEVRCAIRIQGSIYTQTRRNLLCNVAVDESQPKTRKDHMVYLYYANDQEAIWDIAKRYNTSVEVIRAGNQLEGDVCAGKTMLLIPMR